MRWWPVAAAAVLLVVAWLVLGRKTAAPNVAANVTAATGATSAAAPALAPTVAPPVATPELTHRTVLELLSQARIVFRDQTRMLPRFDTSRVPRTGDSALELYAEVLLRDARNEEARDGVRRLGSAVQARVQSDLSAGQIDNATRIVAAYSSAGGDPVQIQKLTADIKSAQPRLLAGQAQHAVAAGDFAAAEQLLTQLNAVSGDRKAAQDLRRAIDSRQTDLQMQKLGEEVRGAIAAGALLEPAATSARAKLMAMRQLNGKHSAAISAQRELQSALLSRASEQQQAQQYDAALRWNSAAVDLGATDEGNEQRIRIRADMDRQATRAAAVAATAAPAPTVAAAVKPAFVIAKAIRPLNVEYPESMLSTAIVGSVVVEFTLRADGSATDVAVVESTPPGTFDKVATAAVARGRFDTSPLGQGKQPKRARIKLSFRP
jgi:TonB family protein